MIAWLVRRITAAWQATARWRTPACRYDPTCSRYASQAIDRHGVIRGSWIALRRISRCHPWSAPSFDPVPPARTTTISLSRKNAA